ncbi:MAG TPA: VOC family protein [Solirubrobacteraceae bacterium]
MADRYIPGVPCWIDMTPPDPAAARDFYGALFGWELENVMPAGEPEYFIARLGGRDVGAIGAAPAGASPVAAWNTYIWVESADETAQKVRAAGGEVLAGPFDAGDAGRMAVFADREGAAFSVWEAGAHRGAEAVNEHGALNFNDLYTRDPEVAAEFYGAVFGWDLLGAGDFSMWALPGYGDFLEQRNPGMRAGMQEMGAPERFEDVVASLIVIAAGEPDVPHWGVTFAVDDADAVAARAAELGGSVLAGPFDAPWVRMAALADPQGATFVASKFVPENKDAATDAGVAAA